MPLSVVISPTGQSATVSGQYHTTQVVGIADAEAKVAFYERLAARKSGRFYQASLRAFRQVLREMRERQGVVSS